MCCRAPIRHDLDGLDSTDRRSTVWAISTIGMTKNYFERTEQSYAATMMIDFEMYGLHYITNIDGLAGSLRLSVCICLN